MHENILISPNPVLTIGHKHAGSEEDRRRIMRRSRQTVVTEQVDQSVDRDIDGAYPSLSFCAVSVLIPKTFTWRWRGCQEGRGLQNSLSKTRVVELEVDSYSRGGTYGLCQLIKTSLSKSGQRVTHIPAP